MEKGKIILLNGVSSAGKTTLSKAIQNNLQTPYYHICCDDFMNMSPAHLLKSQFDKQLLITQSLMHDVIKLFSDKGHCVIVDDVVLDLPDKNDFLYEYSAMLSGYPVMLVHVICPMDELIRRQTIRGDRYPDQAQWQSVREYTNIPYDLTVDTYAESTDTCAERIIANLSNPTKWNALEQIKTLFETQRGVRRTHNK